MFVALNDVVVLSRRTRATTTCIPEPPLIDVSPRVAKYLGVVGDQHDIGEKTSDGVLVDGQRARDGSVPSDSIL